VRLLAERHGERLKRGKEHSFVAEARVGDKRLALAFPQTFMNDSGRAVAALIRRFGVEEIWRLVVVHDELDLDLGKIQVKAGGGLAGHNGLRSIKAHLHTDGFTRVRIGIGKPPGGKDKGVDHVLRPPGKTEQRDLAASIELAADAVERILAEGLAAAQNRFNG